MKKTSKIILALAAAIFVIGSTGGGSVFLYGILKPVAAVLVIVVFLLEVMPKESALVGDDSNPPSSARHTH